MKNFFCLILFLSFSLKALALEKVTFATLPGDVVASSTLFSQLSVTDIIKLDQQCLRIALQAEQRAINHLGASASLYRFGYGTSVSRNSSRPARFSTRCSLYALKAQTSVPDFDLEIDYVNHSNLSNLEHSKFICDQQESLLLARSEVVSVISSSYRTLLQGYVCSLAVVRIKKD